MTFALFLTAASADGDIEALKSSAIQKFWDVMPDFTVQLLRIGILIIPLVMLVAGLLGLLFPPKEPNWYIGYRTRRSTASEEAWFFAQKLRGILWSALGPALLIPSIFAGHSMKGAEMDHICRTVITYGGVQIAVLLLSLLAMRIVMLVRYDRKGKIKVRT